MKKILASTTMLVAVGLLPLATVQPAAAAESREGPAPAASDSATPGFWADVAWFYRLEDCDDAGFYGRRVGTWSAYDCHYLPNRNPDKPWLLHAFYN